MIDNSSASELEVERTFMAYRSVSLTPTSTTWMPILVSLSLVCLFFQKWIKNLSFPQASMVIRQSSYALKAVSKGHTSLGIVAPDGVVIGTKTRKTAHLNPPMSAAASFCSLQSDYRPASSIGLIKQGNSSSLLCTEQNAIAITTAPAVVSSDSFLDEDECFWTRKSEPTCAKSKSKKASCGKRRRKKSGGWVDLSKKLPAHPIISRMVIQVAQQMIFLCNVRAMVTDVESGKQRLLLLLRGRHRHRLAADATKLIDEMRMSVQRFRFNYGEMIPCEGLVADICDVKQSYTQWGGRRPFGVSILFMGWDEVYGYQLYNSDPSGNYSGWKATATGQHFGVASSLLEQEIDPEVSISLEEAKDLAMKVLDCALGTANLIPNKLEMSTLHRASDGCCIYTLFEMTDVEKLTEKYKKGLVWQEPKGMPTRGCSP
ncbi:uncharacterized protein LOC117188711 [Drosophila miranda]|uniref:uncharacterized protein LOC117188711 n=1 Tax=Drosophila miranda TaxID=7229 RepID=UPI00143F178B|nr:uncharacterized protein LOC117188711 [Drosophila miranda]